MVICSALEEGSDVLYNDTGSYSTLASLKPDLCSLVSALTWVHACQYYNKQRTSHLHENFAANLHSRAICVRDVRGEKTFVQKAGLSL